MRRKRRKESIEHEPRWLDKKEAGKEGSKRRDAGKKKKRKNYPKTRT